MYRKTYALIDGVALRNNAKEIIQKYPNYTYYIGVVKNNAYQHGMKVVQQLIEGGINYLAVSSLEEALDIRKYNIDIPILVLEPIDLAYIDDAINNKVTLTIDQIDYLEELCKMDLSYKINVHLKIDSGMNRLGLKTKEEIEKSVKRIEENDKLFLEGIYSHFATSGVEDVIYEEQLHAFKELVQTIDLTKIPIVHLDRSLTFVRHEKIPFVTGVRLGIALFGFNNCIVTPKGLKEKISSLKRNLYWKKHHLSHVILKNDLQLKTAFSLYSTVLSLRKVIKGEKVGYNANYKVKEEGYIATIPIGFADGVTKEFGFVAIHGKKYPIVSDSMDMIMVLVDENVKLKDKVEIFGDTISIREVTNRLGTNAYHLFNQISNRVPRVHVEEDGEVEIKY